MALHGPDSQGSPDYREYHKILAALRGIVVNIKILNPLHVIAINIDSFSVHGAESSEIATRFESTSPKYCNYEHILRHRDVESIPCAGSSRKY